MIRRDYIAEIPISWHGRSWGVSKLKLREMGRRYLATLVKIWFERWLIADDIIAETVRRRTPDAPQEAIERVAPAGGGLTNQSKTMSS